MQLRMVWSPSFRIPVVYITAVDVLTGHPVIDGDALASYYPEALRPNVDGDGRGLLITRSPDELTGRTEGFVVHPCDIHDHLQQYIAVMTARGAISQDQAPLCAIEYVAGTVLASLHCVVAV
jgi:hypothetical protein